MKQSWEEMMINGGREDGKYNNPPSMQIGVINSLEPLQIVTGELVLNRKNLLINRQLLDYTEEIQATTEESDEHTHSIKNIIHKSILKVKDTVILYEIAEGSKYYVVGVAD